MLNLASFEEATFDEVSQEFTWTPADDYVSGPDNFVASQELKLRVTTNTDPALEKDQIFNTLIYKMVDRPEITEISGFKNIMEGESMVFEVKVTDKDSDGVTPPVIQVISVKNRNQDDASSFIRNIKIRREDNNDISKWIFSLQVNTYNKELTSGQSDFIFGLKVFSTLGMPSKEKSESFKITTKVPAPKATLSSQIEMMAGEVLVHNFDIYSPYSIMSNRGKVTGEGEIRFQIKTHCISSFKGLAECECQRKEFWRYSCKLTLNPDASQTDEKL